MEIIENKIIIKLDKEERDNLIDTISFVEQMCNTLENIECCSCPFKSRCDKRSEDICFLHLIKDDLKYINNHCD